LLPELSPNQGHDYFLIVPDMEKPEMIESFGVEKKEVAKWAGM